MRIFLRTKSRIRQGPSALNSLCEELKTIQNRTLESYDLHFLNFVACMYHELNFDVYQFCRNYKREAELARMAWKIKPEDLLPTHLGAKGQFGSRYSLGRISLPVMKIKDVG